MYKFQKPPYLPVLMQLKYLEKSFPEFTLRSRYREQKLLVSGELCPSALSRNYKFKIEYELGMRPNVTLPDTSFAEKRPPHLFSDDSLCLYHRFGRGAWSPYTPLTSLIPLVSHWLWCYEMWESTGVWHADEFPHTGEPKEKR